MLLDILDIMKVLPHRYPFLLVDRVIEIDPGKKLVALKNVTMNEPFFEGHFPGHPVMPGVLIIEAMAQAGGLLVAQGVKGRICYFVSIDGAKFRKPVRPGASYASRSKSPAVVAVSGVLPARPTLTANLLPKLN